MTITRVIYTPEGFATPEDIAANAQASQPTIQPTARWVGETLRETGGGGSGDGGGSERMDFARYVASQAGVPGGSVRATLQGYGEKQSVELIPGQPSSRTLVAHALRDGLLIRDHTGALVDAPNRKELVTAAQQEPQETPQSDPGAEDFDPAEDAAWAEAIQPLDQGAYDGAVASSIGAVLNGHTGLTNAAENLAKAAGMEPGEAHAFVQAGYDLYRGVVDRAVGKLGVNGAALESFYADCRARPRALQDAIQRVVHQRDVGGFQTLAHDYVRRNGGGQ
jgi:hypothetical protein